MNQHVQQVVAPVPRHGDQGHPHAPAVANNGENTRPVRTAVPPPQEDKVAETKAQVTTEAPRTEEVTTKPKKPEPTKPALDEETIRRRKSIVEVNLVYLEHD